MTSKLSFQDIHLLLVEPSLAQCRIIVEHLKDVGLDKIEVAGTGEEALAAMNTNVPDLVLSAMYFDDMTGTELIGAMRANPRLTDVPFMLISSERHERQLDPIRQSGVTAILPKPFKVDDLKKALRASLDFLGTDRLDLGEDVDVEDLRVLVVDDSRWSLRHIVNVLKQLGIERITQAQNGREAAEIIRDTNFDLVVTDYNMPEMDGEQLVNYIRRISDQPDLPILMVTSERDSARLATVEQAGVSALMDKPFDVSTVRAFLQRMLAV